MPETLDVPVLFIVFNRPEVTAMVFECIRAARPSRLFVVADGPRTLEEREICERTRAIATAVDWECSVETNFSETNLGCGNRVWSGINWMFEQCDRAIILEDDCVPNPTFFRYCSELLEKYKDDERIGTISGDNFIQGRAGYTTQNQSYFFSRLVIAWGWATWSRAWRNCDFGMKDWPELRDSGWLAKTYGSNMARVWQYNFDRVYPGSPDIWDTQWQFASLRTGALTIQPAVNLICNIGFGESATHTKIVNHQTSLPTHDLEFPLKHPDVVAPDLERDKLTFEAIHRTALQQRSLPQRIKRKADRIASSINRLISRK